MGWPSISGMTCGSASDESAAASAVDTDALGSSDESGIASESSSSNLRRAKLPALFPSIGLSNVGLEAGHTTVSLQWPGHIQHWAQWWVLASRALPPAGRGRGVHTEGPAGAARGITVSLGGGVGAAACQPECHWHFELELCYPGSISAG
jgi:hypothetical protein